MHFFYIFFENLFFIILESVLNIKSPPNIFIIIYLFIYIFNIFLKKNFYEFYKKTKFYRYIFLNILFYLFLLYCFEFKKNLFFFMKNIYFKIGNEKLNILSFLLTIFWIIFTFLLNIYNGILFDFFFKNLKYLDLNYKILLFRLFILLFFFIILLYGFNILKLNFLILSILLTYVGISLNINVQRLINNYISGLVILFDQNLRIGDAVSVNGHQGVITQINNRCTVLRNLDCSEILVPNEKFLIEIVQNQSLYFSKGNLRINVQISYNNNYDDVLKYLIDSLLDVDRILKTPPALSYITGFTILGVDMELSFWILDAVRGVALIKSDVYLNILKIFKINMVELSYYKKALRIIE